MSTFISHLLKIHFGYDQFRGDQKEIIENTLNKKDSLVIMPTGGGKSLCYQLPALALKGTTIVISPLIALMQDQVQSLNANGISARALNSTNSPQEAADIISKIGTEELKLLYVSPEKAVSSIFINLIRNKDISQIAIDEAHCVSMWGNDFRQEYTSLPLLTKHFNHVPVIALTATADRATQTDINDKLKLKEATKFISSFERENIFINVMPAQKRMDYIIDYLKRRPDESGIIYCLSRKSTEMVADRLRNEGISAFHYHAELSAQERSGVQKAFQQDEIKVICATIAFGMGIDKSNVRFVLHYNLPKNLESYYQEIGRGGRDGLPAESTLFFSTNDGQILRQFIDKSEASEDFKSVQRAKLNRMIEFGLSTNCRTNMILSYFGEYRESPCGHCDNCKNPPKYFDGTRISQIALSALKRTNERIGINMLADILRGSEKQEIQQLGFDKIKTFGAGVDVRRDDWLNYISQLINQGYVDIDYIDYNKLKVTTLGQKVLFNELKVNLCLPVKNASSKYEDPKQSQLKSELFQQLKNLRLTLAKLENVPAYIIFNDATLLEMCKIKPVFLTDMAEISGVGKHKLEKYGQLFLDEIKKFLSTTDTGGDIKDKIQIEIYNHLKKGKTPQEIAKSTGLAEESINDCIADIYENGAHIDISQFITGEEINLITSAWYKLKKTTDSQKIREHLDERFELHKIRLALTFIKEGQAV